MRRHGRRSGGTGDIMPTKGLPPYANKMGIARFLATAPGARVPGVFRKDREYCCVVERTPPYAPKVQPINLAMKSMKTAYITRYDVEATLAGYIREFPITL